MGDSGRHIALPPAVWGPIFWNTIHIVALGYSITPTDEEKKAAKQFYESLTYVIPCPICRVHYKSHLEELPVDAALGGRSDLIEWTWKIHNRVNEELGKPQITIDKFLDHISSLKPPSEQCCHVSAMNGSWKSIAAIAAIGAVVGCCIYTFNRKSK
jgi:hypothetical protein